MPTLPRYNSQQKVRMPQAQSVSFTDKSSQNLIGTLQDIGQQWQKANDVMEYTEAKSQYEVGTERILSRAQQDPDFKNTDQYYKELRDLREESLGKITNAMVREKAALEMGAGNEVASLKIETAARKKRIDHTRFSLSQSVDTLFKKRLDATSETEKKDITNKIEELLSINAGTGVISEEEAYKMYKNGKEKAAEFDATARPELFLSRTNKFYDVSADKYAELRKKARSAKEREEKEIVAQQEEVELQNESDLILQLADREADKRSVSEITDMIANNRISREFGEAYIRVLESPKHIDPKKKIEKSGFTKFAQSLFKADDNESKQKAITEMLNGAADGDLNEEQLAVLLKSASLNDDRGFIAKTVEALGTASKNLWNMQPGIMLYNYFTKMNEGKDPEQAKNEAVKETLSLENEFYRAFENKAVGDNVVLPNGETVIYTGQDKDGEITFELPE